MFNLKSLFCYLSLQPFLSNTCFICHDQCKEAYPLCDECKENLPFLQKICELCATPIQSAFDRICGPCLLKPPPYDRLIALFDYVHPINYFIIQLKFKKDLTVATLLGRLFAIYLKKYYETEPLPQAIIAMPLHRDRLQMRGFNQSTEIAKPIGKALNIPLLYNVAFRNKSTLPQTELTRKERQTNVKSAFSVKSSFKIDHIALLDDVITTGETMQALSRQIKGAGNIRIDAWCVAKRMLDYQG